MRWHRKSEYLIEKTGLENIRYDFQAHVKPRAIIKMILQGNVVLHMRLNIFFYPIYLQSMYLDSLLKSHLSSLRVLTQHQNKLYISKQH